MFPLHQGLRCPSRRGCVAQPKAKTSARLALALIAALVLGGCGNDRSSSQSADSVQAGSVGAAAGTAGGSVRVPALSGGESSAGSSASTPTSTSSIPTTPPVDWTLTPAVGATGISPIAPISVAVANGKVKSVSLTNPEGVVVDGAIAADGLSWTSNAALGYGRTYSVAAVALDTAGVDIAQNYSFTTLVPNNKTLTTAFPTDGMTVGVGQPIDITFDEAIADKAGVEKLITIKTTPEVVGSFYWLSNTEVHWRPQNFWPAGTAVDVSVMIYGRDVGNGIYGQQDKHFAFTIGKSKIAVIDDNTHMMTITVDGAVAREMPVSLGRNKYPTYNGVHVVAEKYESKIMDSSTWGLTGTGSYRTKVMYASRISSSGEFVHAAPWSVDSQGYQDVSHGCVNVSTDNAIWFYDNFGYGDIVDIRNTVGPPLAVWDGYGDWQLPWETYSLGGAR